MCAVAEPSPGGERSVDRQDEVPEEIDGPCALGKGEQTGWNKGRRPSVQGGSWGLPRQPLSAHAQGLGREDGGGLHNHRRFVPLPLTRSVTGPG